MTDETTASGQLAATEPGSASASAAAVSTSARISEGTHARDADFVQSLDRGLAVIRAFGPDRERLSLSEVARATGLTRAAARRFLLTLVRLGYVRSDGREFSLRRDVDVVVNAAEGINGAHALRGWKARVGENRIPNRTVSEGLVAVRQRSQNNASD